MNKKLLLATMSLAALAACTNDDFEKSGSANVAEGTSPVQFEIINDGLTRASMNENTVAFSATDGDLFTLYHGGTCASTGDPLTAYENATYKASAGEGGAVLTTPTMIKKGYAIMTWPADTIFRATGNLSIVIPRNQTDKIQNEIPYVSDLINIQAYAAYNEDATAGTVTAYNTAGKDRKYSVYMRPMASQLNLKADYGDTEGEIKKLYEGAEGVERGEGIDPITVSSVELLTTPGTSGTTPFTTEIPLTFTAQTLPLARWNAADANNAWSHVTGFGTPSGSVDKLTTKYLLAENKGCKFLILPQANITDGVADPGVVVNTIYGKVVIADPSGDNPHGTKYDVAEYANAWYRYLSSPASQTTWENASVASPETSGENRGKYKTVALDLGKGMAQTINYMSTYVAKSSLPTIESEPMGVALTRYVNVNLSHLDMSDLHVKTDKQLRNAARVWQKMNLDDVTVYLDGGQEGDATGEFSISQKTIKVINDINAAVAGGTKSFKVMPCHVDGEKCTNIVITGASDIQTLQDIAFIEAGDNGTKGDTSDDIKANVVLANETNAWKWNVDAATKVASIKVQASAVTRIINKGSILNDADATLKTLEKDGSQNNVPLQNVGKWKVDAGKLFVQFTVSNTNGGELTIKSGAEYRQDGAGHIFYNWANEKPTRFGGDDTKNGKVTNMGVFATVNNGQISNFGLIEHADPNAKTYITYNQSASADFATAFNSSSNKMGRINLPFSNKNEDNISINGSANKGFVSVTVKEDDAPADGILNADVVGERVNYIIVEGGISSIAKVSEQIKYVEINVPNTEVIWDLEAPKKATYEGLMVLSPVNIKLNTEIQVTKACYLGADMYVGGTFNNGTAAALPAWSGYYGDTSSKFATMYVTY